VTCNHSLNDVVYGYKKPRYIQRFLALLLRRKGNCWDNAVAESFFHSLKTELVHHCDFATRAEAKQEIFEYIEGFYNRKRRHSANDYKSPADYEMSLKAA
jgi:transposase InsO family protein